MFYLQVLLSFIIAGSWIALLTILAERFGSKVGGLIVNLPSNIMITLIFITLSHGNGFVQGMLPAIPVGLLIDSVFLAVFILLLRFNLIVSMLGSLGSWIVLAIVADRLQMNILWLNVAIYVVATLLIFLIVEYGWKIPAIGKSGKRYSVGQMAVRAGFAGGIVGGVVLISHFVPAYLTGIVSTFPAVLFSSMVILARYQGTEFARATGKVMILSTSNILVYTLAVYFTYPLIGIVAGTILSFILAFGWIVLLRPLMRRFA
ncbi:MAG: hypothetical protein JXA23_10385 [Bacteroidales bacterium]|nr:hypothetical protein [Bacteroidales bacterium]